MSSRNERRRSAASGCLPIRTRRSSSPTDPVRRRETRQTLAGQCNNPAHNHHSPYSHTPNHRHNRGHARRASSPDQANRSEHTRHHGHRRHPSHAISDLVNGGYSQEDGLLDLPFPGRSAIQVSGRDTHRPDGQPSSSSHRHRPVQERRHRSSGEAGRSRRRNEPRVDVDLTTGHQPVEASSARRRHNLPRNAVDIMEDRWTVSYTLSRSSRDNNASASRSRRSRAPSPPSHHDEPQVGPVANQHITIVSPGPIGIMLEGGEYIPMPSGRRYRFGPLQNDQPNSNNVARTVWQAIRQGEDQPSASFMPREAAAGYLPEHDQLSDSPLPLFSHRSSRRGEYQASPSEQDQSPRPQSPAPPGGSRSTSSSGQPSRPQPEADALKLIKEEEQSRVPRCFPGTYPTGQDQSPQPRSPAPPGDNRSTSPPGQDQSPQDQSTQEQSSQESFESARPRGSSISID